MAPMIVSRKPDDIVITGLGVISPVGNNTQSFWNSLIAGVSGAGRIQAFDPEGFGSTIACEVKDFAARDFMDKRRAKRMARFSQLAVCASLEAMKDSGINPENEDTGRIGCIIGSAAGDYENLESQHRTFFDRGPLKGHPLAVPMIIPNMASGNTAIELGIHGPNFAAVSACATGSHAIAVAAMLLQTGPG